MKFGCFVLFLVSWRSFNGCRETPSTRKPGFFIFGDSTVDAGTNNYINTTKSYRANYFPYGYNGFFQRATGRFSDGRIATDFIAEYASLPLIPPFLQPHADHSHGANFASGGAGILETTHAGLVVDLKTQLKQFNILKEKFILQLGYGDAQKWLQNSVYYISVGSNDIGVYLLDDEAQAKYSEDEFLQILAGEFSSAIQTLSKQGAQKFVIISLANLGCLPSSRIYENGSCVESATRMSEAYNAAAERVMSNLSQIYSFKYIWFNVTEFLRLRTEQPWKYGILHPIDACCGSGLLRGVDTCGGKDGSKIYELCSDSWTHIWFDGYHAPEVIHRQAAKALWEGDYMVQPFPIKVFFNEDLEKDNVLMYTSV